MAVCHFCSRLIKTGFKSSLLASIRLNEVHSASGILGVFTRRHSYSSRVGHEIKSDGVERIRNIGILAHVDAGKTTLTEKMLYAAGVTQSVGDVDKGTTITDFMEMERERGITINSAVVNFNWTPSNTSHRSPITSTSENKSSFLEEGRPYLINLIDTPGHVDFTIEVERCLRVLDGAVVLIDASAGVQPQTLTVWRQADKYSLPRIVLLNKLDKPNAMDLKQLLQNLQGKLTGRPLLCHLPLFDMNADGSKKKFQGFVDLIEMNKYVWLSNDNKSNASSKISEYPKMVCFKLKENEDKVLFEQVLAARENLVNILSDYDESIADYILSNSYSPINFDANLIKTAIRSTCCSGDCYPVFCASAFKNIGIENCLNSICEFLPSPISIHQKNHPQLNKNHLSAFVFKIFSNFNPGSRQTLSYVRVYSGVLRPGDVLNVVNCGKSVVVPKKLYEPFGDALRPVREIPMGRLGVLIGLKHVRNGDTLCNKEAIEARSLDGFSVPKPVVYCTVEAESSQNISKLEEAIKNLCREDPSLSLLDEKGMEKSSSSSVSSQSSEIVLGGMGQLHLEVVKHRLKKEYGLNVSMGPLNVQYRETITRKVSFTHVAEVALQGTNHKVELSVALCPIHGKKFMKKLNVLHNLVVLECDEDDVLNDAVLLKAIKAGIQDSLTCGNLGYGVHHIMLVVRSVKTSPQCSPAVVHSAVSTCIRLALKEAESALMEPLMDIEMTVPNDVISDVIDDITNCRMGQLVDMSSTNSVDDVANTSCLKFAAPLRNVLNFSSEVRIKFSGRVGLDSMMLGSYDVTKHL